MEPLPASITSQQIVPDCLKACTQDGGRCQAFMIQYPFSPSTTPCLSLDRGIGIERAQLLPRGDTAYFEKICVKHSAGKMWFNIQSAKMINRFYPTKIFSALFWRIY